MSTTTHAQPLIEDSLLNPPLYPSTFNLHPSPTGRRRPKSFYAFTDALRHASTGLDSMLTDLDLSQDETAALLASQKFASHRKLRTTLLSQQLQIAAQDHAQHALGTLLKLTDSHHPAIARLAATQLLAFANLTPPPPTALPQSPPATAGAVLPLPAAPLPTIPPTPTITNPPPTPAPSSPPFIIYNSEFTLSPPAPPPPPVPSSPQARPPRHKPPSPSPTLHPAARSTTTTLARGFVFCVLSFAFPLPLCFPVSNPILPIPLQSFHNHRETSSSGTEKGTLVSSDQLNGQDGQPTPITTTLSRRTFVSLLGLGSAAALVAGCQNDPAAPHAAAGTHDVIPPARPISPPLAGGDEFAPPVPTRPLPPPPVKVEPRNTYGILPRSMWARGGPNLATIDPMNGVKLITFHHSGDPVPFWPTDFGETAQHLESVRAYHRSRNFQDIGYHFAIDRVGRVWQLRSMKYQGQHVRYNNEHNLGVVVLGNFDLQPMTQAQKDKVRIFGLLLRKEYGLPISRVYTHREIVSTECPGRNMQPYMVAIRKQRLI